MMMMEFSESGKIARMSLSYLPGTASLLEELDKKLMVLLRDGRYGKHKQAKKLAHKEERIVCGVVGDP
jgi:hypothetical protein